MTADAAAGLQEVVKPQELLALKRTIEDMQEWVQG